MSVRGASVSWKKSGGARRRSSSAATFPKFADPLAQCRELHEIHDPLRRNSCLQRGRKTKLDEFQLIGMVRVRAERNSGSGFTRDLQQRQIEILSIRVAVDLDGLVEPGGRREHLGPVRGQSETKIVNAPPRMTENVDVRISKGREVAERLVFLRAQGRMKCAQHYVEPGECRQIHVPFATRIQIH